MESLIEEMLFPKKVDTASTRYESSQPQYAKFYGVSVKKVGLIISKKQPWLCVSLDGVVIENGLVSKILEIKCPSSCAKRPVFDSVLAKFNVSYLQFQSGQA